MAVTFRAQDGREIREGTRVTLELEHGPNTRSVEGTIETFVDAEGERRWQIRGERLIGFRPEHVQRVR